MVTGIASLKTARRHQSRARGHIISPHQARVYITLQDLKIVRQNEKLVCFRQEGWGLGRGTVPPPQFSLFFKFGIDLVHLGSF